MLPTIIALAGLDALQEPSVGEDVRFAGQFYTVGPSGGLSRAIANRTYFSMSPHLEIYTQDDIIFITKLKNLYYVSSESGETEGKFSSKSQIKQMIKQLAGSIEIVSLSNVPNTMEDSAVLYRCLHSEGCVARGQAFQILQNEARRRLVRDPTGLPQDLSNIVGKYI